MWWQVRWKSRVPGGRARLAVQGIGHAFLDASHGLVGGGWVGRLGVVLRFQGGSGRRVRVGEGRSCGLAAVVGLPPCR